MKIRDIKTHLVSVAVETKNSWVSSLGKAIKRDSLIVEMESDNGIIGFGECYHGSSPLVLERLVQTVLTPVLLGKDPMMWESNKALMFRRCKLLGSFGLATMAISGLEIAMLDIVGKHLSTPLYQMMGGCRDWAPMYVGGLCLGWKDIDDLCEEAKRYVDMGFTSLKLRVGRSPHQDVDCVRAVRGAVGDDINLMVDVNQDYTDSIAKRILKEYEKYNLFWIEEPVHYEKLETMAQLRKQTFVKVAAGENSFTLNDFRRVFECGAVDTIQPDCCKIGGISEGKKVAVVAEAYKIDVAPHIIGTSVALAAALQLVGSIPNGTLVEWDASEGNLFRDAIVLRPFELKAGQIRVPDGPGLGVEVNRDFLREYRYVDGPCYI